MVDLRFTSIVMVTELFPGEHLPGVLAVDSVLSLPERCLITLCVQLMLMSLASLEAAY